jgi:hypothetical protein
MDAKQLSVDAKQQSVDAKQLAMDAKHISVDAKQTSVDAKQLSEDAKQLLFDAKQKQNFENQVLFDVKQKLIFENQVLFDVKRKLIFKEQRLIDAKQSLVDANQLPLDARSRIDASIPPSGGGDERIARPMDWDSALSSICAASFLASFDRGRRKPPPEGGMEAWSLGTLICYFGDRQDFSFFSAQFHMNIPTVMKQPADRQISRLGESP